MIKLFSVKDKKKEQPASTGKASKQCAGELRLQKDLSDLNLPDHATIHFPEGRDKLMHFEVTIRPSEGFFRSGRFTFDFSISAGYPHDAPKVKCRTKIFHPNIDSDGNICLNILREDWKPVLSINSIIYGLQFLFLDPNPEDPLNKEAAQLLQDNAKQFEALVQRSILHGHCINNIYFPPCV